ncbi:hypothetical protein AB0F20_37115 [Streptomyces goshikiensis]|uniref:hypothetical protein n=1 Tax=Streptomyces goshikiensis TaxID=1942 RepID=UPI0033FC8469
MTNWVLDRARRGYDAVSCVVGGTWTRIKPSKTFVIVVVVAVLAVLVLVACGVPPTVSVQVAGAVLGGIEAIRPLTAKAVVVAPGAAG